MTAPLSTSLAMPLGSLLAYRAEYRPTGYREATKPFIGSNLCFQSDDVFLKICFPQDRGLTISLTDPQVASSLREGGYLAVLRGGPLHVAPDETHDLLNRHPIFLRFKSSAQMVSNLESTITIDDDIHRKLLWMAIEGKGKINGTPAIAGLKTYFAHHHPFGETAFRIPFYELEEQPFEQLAKGNAYRDHPPTTHASIPDFLLRLFDPHLGPAHHGLAGFVDKRNLLDSVALDPNTGVVRPDTSAETRARIRASMEHNLAEISRLKSELTRNPQILEEEAALAELVGGIEGIKKALDQNQLPTVVQWLKKNRTLATYPRMKDVLFPNGDSDNYHNKEVLANLLLVWRDIARDLREAAALFRETDYLERFGDQEGAHSAFNRGVAHYKNGLRYLSEDIWPLLAGGRGPLVAMGQLRMESVVHLGADAVGAHCRRHEGDVCQEFVSANYFGFEPVHIGSDDLEDYDCNGPWDCWRPQNDKAIVLTQSLLLYANITDPMQALQLRQEILDRYWPGNPASLGPIESTLMTYYHSDALQECSDPANR
ncbi:MAG: hypothetical protein HY539_05230 [Deltaproteobacteria bacterium]|nr:hypothetical protein [Deltaproteobacteria bacterium]